MGHLLDRITEMKAWVTAHRSTYVSRAEAAALDAQLDALAQEIARGMAVKLSTAVRNARGNAIESTIGTGPTLRIRTGSAPANPAAADTGTVLSAITLPSDWWGDAAAGSKSKLGTWSATNSATGAPGHFRIYDSGGTCHFQGTCTATGGGGDMTVTVDGSGNLVSGGTLTVTTFTWTEANA